MEENALFKENGIEITNTRIVFPDQTFAMSKLTSIRFRKKLPPYVLIIILIIAGLGAVIGFRESLEMTLPGAAVALCGILLLIFMKAKFYAKLTFASGECRTIETKDEKFISRINETIGQVLIQRG